MVQQLWLRAAGNNSANKAYNILWADNGWTAVIQQAQTRSAIFAMLALDVEASTHAWSVLLHSVDHPLCRHSEEDVQKLATRPYQIVILHGRNVHVSALGY